MVIEDRSPVLWFEQLPSVWSQTSTRNYTAENGIKTIPTGFLNNESYKNFVNIWKFRFHSIFEGFFMFSIWKWSHCIMIYIKELKLFKIHIVVLFQSFKCWGSEITQNNNYRSKLLMIMAGYLSFQTITSLFCVTGYPR